MSARRTTPTSRLTSRVITGCAATLTLMTMLPVDTAAARPNCDVPTPPPVCEHDPPTPPRPLPPAVDQARFSWQLDRLNQGSVGDGAVAETNFDATNESQRSPVLVNGCGSSAAGGKPVSYSWTFGTGTAPTSPSPRCSYGWLRPLSHTAASTDVTLTVTPSGRAPFSVTHAVNYRDVVIASLGDSAASGQGAPERLRQPKPVFTASSDCNRSGWAASAQIALRIQSSTPETTVHFWHLACSGAHITGDGNNDWRTRSTQPLDSGGMLQPYNGAHSDRHLVLPPQVTRLGQLIQQSGLPVDRLLLTVGANDTHWATVVQPCLAVGLGAILLPGQLDALQAACIAGYRAKVQRAVNALPAHFDKLRGPLEALVPRQNIYLSEYFDPLDSLTPPVGICVGEIFASHYLRLYADVAVEFPLQDIVRTRAAAYGWHFVGGIRAAFQRHGICQLERVRWTNSVSDSKRDQGDIDGSWHANRTGQLVMADVGYPQIAAGLRP